MDDAELKKLVEQQIQTVFEFRSTLTPETDRGCALMASAYLDSQLEALIRKRFVNDSNIADELLGLSKPLSTFSSRIDLAFLLGCIGVKERRDLHLIRKIRNDFGHDPTPITFEHPPIASRCSELTYSYHEAPTRARAHFTSAVFAVLAKIHGSMSQSSHPAICPDSEITEEMKAAVREKARNAASDPNA